MARRGVWHGSLGPPSRRSRVRAASSRAGVYTPTSACLLGALNAPIAITKAAGAGRGSGDESNREEGATRPAHSHPADQQSRERTLKSVSAAATRCDGTSKYDIVKKSAYISALGANAVFRACWASGREKAPSERQRSHQAPGRTESYVRNPA
jgi:hypothetical protein